VTCNRALRVWGTRGNAIGCEGGRECRVQDEQWGEGKGIFAHGPGHGSEQTVGQAGLGRVFNSWLRGAIAERRWSMARGCVGAGVIGYGSQWCYKLMCSDRREEECPHLSYLCRGAVTHIVYASAGTVELKRSARCSMVRFKGWIVCLAECACHRS
jgi:hypothetical protein